jgi:hypothetical protein
MTGLPRFLAKVVKAADREKIRGRPQEGRQAYQ